MRFSLHQVPAQTEVLAPTLYDILQQVNGSHKSISIHKDCNLVNGLHRWWSLRPPTSWGLVSVFCFTAWFMRGQSKRMFLNHSTWQVALGWNSKTHGIIIDLLLPWWHVENLFPPILIMLFLSFPPQQSTSSYPCLSNQPAFPAPHFSSLTWLNDQCLPLIGNSRGIPPSITMSSTTLTLEGNVLQTHG